MLRDYGINNAWNLLILRHPFREVVGGGSFFTYCFFGELSNLSREIFMSESSGSSLIHGKNEFWFWTILMIIGATIFFCISKL